MPVITIYHNPRCSKSRTTLQLLHERGLVPVIVEYLKTPLNLEQLKTLLTHFTLQEFVRTDEKVFKEMGLTLNNAEDVLMAIIKEPILMQRPIVTFDGRAVIGRPPEQVLQLFE